MKQLPYKKYVFFLIIFFSIIRIIVGGLVELGNDESYYWLYSQQLQWNYFDHPPMVALWARFFSLNLLFQGYPVFLRLGSIVGCALSTWFIFKCVSVIKNERAGWFAACLYNASFYAGITAGLFLMPDAPQMIFWTFSLWMIARLLADDRSWQNWIMLGLASGLCIMSKVHGIFLWGGLGLFILVKKLAWFGNYRLYMALLFAIIIASPILIWNLQNNFITYRFHSERMIINGHETNWYNLFKAFISLLVINNPVNALIILIALLAGFKKKKPSALILFNFIGIPFIFILLFIAFFRQTLPHWSGPAFIALIPIAATWLSELEIKKVFPRVIQWSTGLYLIFLIGCPLVIYNYPGNFGTKNSEMLGKGDITLDMYGWEKAGKEFTKIYQQDVASGIMPAATPVVCNNWWGAHEEYYFCRPAHLKMLGLGPVNEIHQYAWLNAKRSREANLGNAYCIIHSDENYNANDEYGKFYASIDTAATIKITRSNKPAHNFYILRLKGWKNVSLTIYP